jgi:hypothetical protein
MLEVEATGDAIHIEQFTHQVKAGAKATFHRGQVHFTEGYAARCHEFLPEGTAAAHPVAASQE